MNIFKSFIVMFSSHKTNIREYEYVRLNFDKMIKRNIQIHPSNLVSFIESSCNVKESRVLRREYHSTSGEHVMVFYPIMNLKPNMLTETKFIMLSLKKKYNAKDYWFVIHSFKP